VLDSVAPGDPPALVSTQLAVVVVAALAS